MRSFALLISLLCLASCGFSDPHANDGKLFKSALTAAIGQADKIVVVEHSDAIDFVNSEGQIPDDPPKRVYGRVELEETQKRALLSSVQSMSSDLPEAVAACELVAHHTIELYEKGRLISEIQVCFECGDVDWSGSKWQYPIGVFSALAPTILSTGMKEERDWRLLATSSP
jgi:hypothetical protein